MDASDDILIDPTGRNRALYEFRSNKIHMKYNSCIAFGTDESLGYIEIDEVYTHIKSYNFKDRVYDIKKSNINHITKYLLSSMRIDSNHKISYQEYFKRKDSKVNIRIFALGFYFDFIFCCFVAEENLFLKTRDNALLDLSNNTYVRPRSFDNYTPVYIDTEFFSALSDF